MDLGQAHEDQPGLYMLLPLVLSEKLVAIEAGASGMSAGNWDRKQRMEFAVVEPSEQLLQPPSCMRPAKLLHNLPSSREWRTE